MRVTFVLGGARSGKTRYALEEALRLGGDRVSYVATAETDAGDPELSRRVAHHRKERPAAWQTVEEPRDPARALESAVHDIVVLDCLTMLLAAHVSGAATEEDVGHAAEAVVESLLAAAAGRPGELLVVSNEVGQGVVPVYPAGRWFRDVQGRANQRVAAEAERMILMVAGLPLVVREV